MIWTINRIKQNFRTTRGIKFSNKTIMHFAKQAGYSLKHAGGIIGYDQSVYTALTKAFSDMVEYEKGLRVKQPQKAQKREIDYNPDKFIEPDRTDYEWEKNENRNMIFYSNNPRGNKKIFLSESRLRSIIEESVDDIVLEGSRFFRKKESPVYFSMDDELKLSEDPLARLDKEKQTGKLRNFAIERNGKQFWVSRSSIVTLYVFCKNENGEWCVLASQRGKKNKWGGKWNVVCGFLDYGESLEDAARRECYEECGVNVGDAKLINCGTNSSFEVNGPVNHSFACILDGTIKQYKPSMENCEGYGTEEQEVQNVAWIPISGLGKVDMRSSHKTAAKQIINNLAHDESGNSENYRNLLETLYNMFVSNELDGEKYNQIIKILKK